MERPEEKDRVKLLTMKNRHELVWVIDLIIERYAFSQKDVLSVFINNIEELDKIMKFFSIAEHLKLAKNLLEPSAASENPYPMMFVIRVKYDELLEFKKKLLNDVEPTEIVDTKKFSKSDTPVKEPIPNIQLHPLKPQHYSDRKGILVLNPTTEIAISIKGRTMHKNGKPYAQCKLMTELFRYGKTLKSGIFFSKFYGVNDRFIDKKMEKKIRNAVSEINKKVAAVGGPKNLIYIQDKKVHVNHSYL